MIQTSNVYSHLKGPYKAVIETKWALIKANLSEPPLETNNNHMKKAEIEYALSQSDVRITRKIGINTNSIGYKSPHMQ
jgi:hypothetical protein